METLASHSIYDFEKAKKTAHSLNVHHKEFFTLDISKKIKLIETRLTTKLLAHPFLIRCELGQISMGELRNFLIQHGKYSRYFTRYLCALISNLTEGVKMS